MSVCIEWNDAAKQREAGYDSCSAVTLTCGPKTDSVNFVNPPALPTGNLQSSDISGSALTAITVGEGRSVDFRVRLTVKPTSNVTVTISRSDSSANISYDKSSLTFTTSNWSTWQTITVTAPTDNDTQNETDSLTFSGTGGIVNFEDTLQVTANDYPQGNITLSPSGSLSITEGGTSGSFGVSLSQQPSTSQVTVSVVSGDTGAVTVSPASLTFGRLNHSTPQSVTVTSVQDSDYADESVSITFSITDGGLAAPDATGQVSVTDDDAPPGNIYSFTTGSITITEGRSLPLNFFLSARPVRPVTVSLTSSDTGALSVSPATLAFTSGNYNTAKTATITGVQDNDYAHENVTLTLSATGGIDAPSITRQITVTDNDTPPGNFTLTPSTIDLFEGTTGTFTVMFDTQPNQPVTVSISSGDTAAATISPSSLSFDSSNYDIEQIVTITAVQDNDSDGESVTITLSASGGIEAPNATATAAIRDDEAPAGDLTVSPSTLDIDEGGTGTFTVVLDTRPSAPTIVSITANDNGAVTISPTSLTFDSSNHDTAQSVTVTALQDSDHRDEEITIALSVSGGLSATTTMTIDVSDDETPSGNLVITPSDALTIAEGGTGALGVSLDTAPTSDITVSVASSDTGALTVSPSSLTFTPRNHSKVQTLTLTSVRDGDHSDEAVDITFSIASGGGIIASDLTKRITVRDDDTPSGRLAVSPAGSHTLREGSSDTFTVALSDAPNGDVTVALRSGDLGAVSVSPASLTFTSNNHDTAQRVTLTAVDDEDTDSESVEIVLTTSGQFDAPVVTKTVRVNDDDWGIVVIPSGPLTLAEGDSKDFEVALSDRPPGQISISLSSDHPALSLSPSVLIFSATNHDSPQTVSVTAAEDDDTNYETATITLDPPADTLSASVTKSVLVSDNDATDPGTQEVLYTQGSIQVFPAGPLVIAEQGSGRFSVRLSDAPTASVSVRVSKNPADITLSPSSLIFTPDNYDSPRFITVTAGQNNNLYDTPYTIAFSAGGTRLITRKVIVGGSAGRVRTQALALPPSDSKDFATLRVRCNQDSPCTVTFDCSTQNEGLSLRGAFPKTIPARSVKTFTAAEIEEYVGGSWSGKGRLGCALLSDGNISSQVWTRSGNGVLVNNSALIRSAPDGKGIHRADIESIPSPDSPDESNIRVRCSSLVSNCNDMNIRCYDDSGTKYETDLRAIEKGATRHLQSETLSGLIGHRWSGLGLSCEISSAAQFTIQVLTRTGGGGALVNNSQSGTIR